MSDFEQFWRVYPKRSGSNPKGPARKRFEQRVKEGIRPERLIERAERYRKWCDSTGKTGGELVARAVTWLSPNYEGWEQEWTLPERKQLVNETPPKEVEVEVDPKTGRLRPVSL